MSDILAEDAVHRMAKMIFENSLKDAESLEREVAHQTGLMTGLSGIAFVIMAFMTWWGLSGAQGSEWQTNWIWTGAVFIVLLGIFSLITASNIRQETRRRIDSLRRSVEAQDEEIAKINGSR
jgi:Na+/melibiose symporter-like transporter